MNPVITVVIILSMLLSSIGPMQISARDLADLSKSAIAVNTQNEATQTPTADWPYPPPAETPTVEPSSTETPLPTATATVEPATATPTAQATITPNPSPTAYPTPETPVDLHCQPNSDLVKIKVDPEPAIYLPGKPIVLSWKICGYSQIKNTDAQLVINIPEGVTPKEKSLQQQITPERTLTISTKPGEDKITWLVSDTAPLPFRLVMNLLVNGEAKDAQSILINSGKYQMQKGNNSQIDTEDGQIQIDVPADAASEDLTLDVRPPSFHKMPAVSLTGYPVEIIAVGKSTGTNVTKFQKPITIKIKYDKERIFGKNEGDLMVFYFNEDDQDWYPLETTVDQEKQTLTAVSDHLTVFDYKATSWQKYTPPTVDAFKVSDFTGAGTYSYDFWTPPAPAGLSPKLQLSYNSQVIDEALSAYTQASWVGMGWSLDTGAITRNMHGTDSTAGPGMSTPEDDDTFSISAGGISGTLLPVGNNADGTITYNTADQSFAKVIWNKGDVWTVYSKDGFVYTFNAPAKTNKSSGCSTSLDITWRWSLGSIRDTHGNEITYGYSPEKKPDRDGYTCSNQIAVYPDWIEYPNHLYRITFVRQARTDYQYSWTQRASRVLYGTQRLSEVQVLARASTSDPWPTTPVRKYVFTYEVNNPINPALKWSPDGNLGPKTLTLASIQEFGMNGSSQKPVTFIYGDSLHLTKVDNGQGGAVTMQYEKFSIFDDVGDNQRSYSSVMDSSSSECYFWRNSSNSYSVGCTNPQDPNDHTHGYLEIGAVMPSAAIRDAFPEELNKPGNRYRLLFKLNSLDDPRGNSKARLGIWDRTHLINTYATMPDPNDPTKTVPYEKVIPKTYDANSPANVIEASIDYPVGYDPMATGPFVECDWCDVRYVQIVLFRTYYRVTSKTIQDLGINKATSAYSYDNPSPDTVSTSDAVSQATSGVDANFTCPTTSLYTCQMAEFRGHSMTQTVQDVVDENNVVRKLAMVNWYYQTDGLKGRSYRTLTMQRDLYDNWSAGLGNWTTPYGVSLTSSGILGKDFDSNLLLSFSSATDANWAKIKRTSSLPDGKAVIAQIRLDASLSNLSGDPDPTPHPKAKAVLQVSDTEYFGVQLDKSTDKATVIVNGASTQDLITGIQMDKWYVVMLIADAAHGNRVRIWQLDKPENTGEGIATLVPSGALYFSAQVNSASLWMSAYTEGTIYQETSTIYGSQIVYVTGAGNADAVPAIKTNQALSDTHLALFKDLGVTWSYPIRTETRNYDGHATWTGSDVLIDYQTGDQNGLQYGNPTRKTYQEWNGNQFTNHHASKVQYWPNKAASTYITGLPGREITLDCNPTCDFANESGLLAETLYFYDQNASYTASPTKGDLTTKLVRAEKDGETAKYAQSSFTYTTNGNPEKTIAFKAYTTTTPLSTSDTALAGGGVSVTKKFYDPDPVTGAAYNTYVTRETVYTLYDANDANAKGQTTYTSYDYNLGLPTKVTDANGNQWGQAYDGLGRTIAICAPGDWDGITCAPGNGTSTLAVAYFDYASALNPFHIQLTQKQDSQRNIGIVRYYSGIGLLLQEQTLGVDVSGMSIVQNLVTDYEYDKLGRLIHQTKPYPYSAANYSFQTQTFISPRSVITTSYDVLSRVRTVIAPNGVKEQDISYDQLITTRKDGNTNPTKTTKDVWGNIVAVDGPTTNFDEETGQTLSAAAPAAPGLLYIYDKIGNLRFAKVGSGPSQYTTEIRYDKASRKVWMNDPDLGTWSYDYDGAGNLACQKDAKNNSVKLVYDKFNRLSGKDYLGAAACTPETTEITNFTGYDIQFHYDGEAFTYLNKSYGGETGVLGLRTSMVDPSGVTQWSYDWRGRKTHESRTVIDQADNNRNLGTYHTYWSYNPDDSVRQVVYPNQETVNYTYHAGGAFDQAFSVQDDTENNKYYVQGTGYDADGRVVARTLGENLLSSSYTYNPWSQAGQGGRLGRLLTQKSGSNSVFQDLNYSYDPVGNITGIQNNANAAFSYSLTFQYDKLNRLDLATGAYTENPVYSLATGNIASRNGVTYNYGNTPQKHAVTSTSDGRSFDYDANGNMKTRNIPAGSYTLTYDAENRLTNISSGATPTARYVYDGDGQRVISIVGTTRTIYIGNVFEVEIGQNDTPSNNPIGTSYCDFHCPNRVYLPIIMNDQNGTMPITSGPTYHSHPARPTGGIKWRTYYYAAGQRIATRETTSAGMGNPFYLLSDHLGSTTVTVNKDGQKTAEIFYKAWGEIDTDPNRTNGTTPTLFRYTGQYEAEAGLLFYGSRFYDPVLTRFIQPDNVIPGLEGPLNWDRFAYVRNSPIVYNDPTGHCPLCITAAIGAAIGAAVDYGFQVADNLRANQSLGDALVNVDLAEVAGAAVAGGVAGFTLGVGTVALAAVGGAAATTSIAAVPVAALAGGLGNGIGGQLGALTEATGHQLVKSNFNQTEFFADAHNAGFLNTDDFLWDVGSGAIFGAGGQAFSNLSAPSSAAKYTIYNRYRDLDGNLFRVPQNTPVRLPWEYEKPVLKGSFAGFMRKTSSWLQEMFSQGIDRYRMKEK